MATVAPCGQAHVSAVVATWEASAGRKSSEVRLPETFEALFPDSSGEVWVCADFLTPVNA